MRHSSITRTVLLLAFWAITSIGFAQANKPDILVKTDNSRIVGRVIGVDASTIRYRKLKETTVRRIGRAMVWKIMYASSIVRIITVPLAPDVRQPAVAEQPPVEDTIINQQAELDKIILDLEKEVSIQDRKIRLRPIFFDTGSNTVLPESFAYLDSIARFLAKIPTVIVEVGGHTDNTGSVGLNNQLSQRRADAVRNYLVNQGKIAASRIRAQGYGMHEPVAKNSTELGKALNRRVELKFLESSTNTHVILLRNGQRIPVTLVIISTDGKTIGYRQRPNTPLTRIGVADVRSIEHPDGSRQVFGSADKGNPKADVPSVKPVSQRTFSIQVTGLPAYMLGTEVWTSLPNGYGHTLGGGSSLQVDYWLKKRLSMGVEAGYGVWNTQVNVVNSPGEQPYATYYNRAARYSLLAHVRLGLGNHFYLMPQGGIAQLSVSIYNDAEKVSFSGLQTMYGGTLGYLVPIGRRWHVDAGLFYQTAIETKNLRTDYGVDPMQYAGIRLGLGFSH